MIAIFATVFALAVHSQPVVADVNEDAAAAIEKAIREALPDGAALLFDLPSGRVVAAVGSELLLEPRPAGSLLKLFTVYALLSGGTPTDEVYYCEPSSPDVASTASCWYRPGHGNMTLKSALAHSCNAYFRQWIAGKDLSPVRQFYMEARLVLTGENGSEGIDALAAIGLTTSVRLRPVDIVAAAAALFNGGVVCTIESPKSGTASKPIGFIAIDSPALKFIREGLAEGASSGTGSTVGEAIGHDRVLTKTGTSPHWKIEGGTAGQPDFSGTDGWCLVIYPSAKPDVVLLVLAPGGRGADEAATAAAAILDVYVKQVNSLKK